MTLENALGIILGEGSIGIGTNAVHDKKELHPAITFTQLYEPFKIGDSVPEEIDRDVEVFIVIKNKEAAMVLKKAVDRIINQWDYIEKDRAIWKLKQETS